MKFISVFLLLIPSVASMGHTNSITSHNAHEHMHHEVERFTHDDSGEQRKLAFLSRSRGKTATEGTGKHSRLNNRRGKKGTHDYMHTVEVAQSYNSRDEELIERLVELQK